MWMIKYIFSKVNFLHTVSCVCIGIALAVRPLAFALVFAGVSLALDLLSAYLRYKKNGQRA